MFLEGKKIYLRALSISDADVANRYLDWVNDSEIRQAMGTLSFPTSKEQLIDYIKAKNNDPNVAFFAIVDKETKKHVGNVKLEPINWIDRRAIYGVLIGDKNSRGKGYGTEVLKLVLDYAFFDLNLNRVEAAATEKNQASVKHFLKVGFVVEGTFRKQKFQNGEYVDSIYMAILREEYIKLKQESQ